MKRGGVEIAALLVLSIAKLTRGDAIYSRKDPCIDLCQKAPTFIQNIDVIRSCCQRGCRFFNLADLHSRWEPNSLNGTRDVCDTSCTEAYTNAEDISACGMGCDLRANQRVTDLTSLFSTAKCILKKNLESKFPNVFSMSPDMPENDILTDPGLRKELLPGWWNTDGFKLPKTYIKTVPMDAGTVDYALSSDYSGETEQTSMPGSNFHDGEQIRIPYWDIKVPFWKLFVSAAVALFIMFYMLWLCLLRGDVPTTSRKDVLIDMSSSLAFMPDEAPAYIPDEAPAYIPDEAPAYIPDEAPLYEDPPPEYSSCL